MEQPIQPDTPVPEDLAVDAAEEATPEDETFGAPNGAALFVAVLLIFYILYYGLHYYEIFVLRG